MVILSKNSCKMQLNGHSLELWFTYGSNVVLLIACFGCGQIVKALLAVLAQTETCSLSLPQPNSGQPEVFLTFKLLWKMIIESCLSLLWHQCDSV